MIKNYLVSGVRALLRHKTFAVLNVFGLAVGIAAGMLILQYVEHELSYDSFHQRADRIFRVDHRFMKNGQLDFGSARTYPRVGPAMFADFAEVENFCRLVPEYRGALVRYNEIAFHEENVWYADSSLLTMFTFPWIEGDQHTSLTEVNTAVVEESVARKYFGDASPVGKRISLGSMNGTIDVEVRGVFRVPANSHLPMNVVVSYPTVVSRWGESAQNGWGWYDFHTYLLLRPGTDVYALEQKLPAFVDRNGGPRLNSDRVQLSLRPLSDIHLNSHLMMEAGVNGSSRIVYFLLLLGIATLVIAWINYINLATARAMERAREVGVRKVSGSSRLQLGMQFMLEAFIVNTLSLVFAIALIAALLPIFNELTGKTFDLTIMLTWSFAARLFLLLLAGSLLTGFYPALVLSSFRPITVLKGSLQHASGGQLFRKVMVVGQFMASVVLIAGTMIVFSQLQHLQSIELGINIDDTMVIKVPEVVDDRIRYNMALESYRDEMMNHPGVMEGTISSEIPGRAVGWYGGGKQIGIDQELPSAILYLTTVDANYFNLYGIDVVAGRTYDPVSRFDSANVVINSRAVQSLGFPSAQEAIQGKILLRGDTLNVIGVVEDYHHESPKDDYRPSAYILSPDERAFFSFRVSEATPAVVDAARARFASFFPGVPFEHFFLHDMYQQQYESENKFLSVFTVFAILAIVIASLGLFGLSAYTISLRTKEVGIRKVLGSSMWQIFVLFSRDFLTLILISNLIAIPIVWTTMNNWLSSFVERIDIEVGVFVVTAFVSLILAIGTISYHVWKSATLNPARALRSE